MTPSQLVDLRTALFRWHDTPHALKIFEAHWGEELYASRDFSDMRGGTMTPRQFIAAQRAFIRSAPLYLVDEPMMPLVRQAGATLPDIVNLDERDMPSMSGLIVFSGPIQQVTLDSGEVQDVIALLWVQVGRIVSLSLYEDREGGTYPGTPEEQQLEHDAARRFYPRLVDLGRAVITLGHGRLEDAIGDSWVAPTIRTALATFLLMQQKIATSQRERADRGATRRAERADIDDTSITVIRLRRQTAPTSDDAEARAVDWSHRWLVSGHWRQQWVPSIEAHRPTWIAPYVKGPEHLPLVVKEKVTVLAR